MRVYRIAAHSHFACKRQACLRRRPAMGKILPLLLLGITVLHLIKPLGLPGLRRRGDAWKIAVAAIVSMMLTALIRP